MFTSYSLSGIVRTIGLAAGILSLASPYAAGADAVRTADITLRGLTVSDFPRMIKLADNIYVYEAIQPAHLKMGNFVTNVFIVVTNDGVLVADGFGSEDMVKQMVAAIGKITSQPIKYVVVGADHGDHRGGDGAYPADAKFLASAASKAVLDAEAKAPGHPPASRTVLYSAVDSDKTTLRIGTTEIQILNLGRAHTGGDLEVFLPRENILYLSEVFLRRMFPSMHTAYPSEWAEALRRAEAMHAQNYIPGHGFIDAPGEMREELVNYRKCMEYVVAEGKRLHDAGVPVEEAAYHSDLGEYAYWTRAGQNAHDAFKRIYLEADGKLK